ncbi:MAG: 5-dehydro-2-deoxygluconokinase [Salinisphaera sp.]|jgi:5-dehydro-2-deoxygluconokinase|nr:5-dehydro-2-deoxygluconokinase [Salinisphaera sp.]
MSNLARLAGNHFLVIGRAGMDLYADPPGVRIENSERFTAALGGSAANIAVALTRQGAGADLLTCVSDDAVGRFCLEQLDAYGVNRDLVKNVGGGARNSLSVVETRLENCQSVIYRNGAADFELTEADVESVQYDCFSGLVVTGTALALEPPRAAVFRALELARTAGLPVILDIDYRPYSWTSVDLAASICAQAAGLSDVVVGNDVEFGVMAGNHDEGLANARQLVSKGAAIAIYKMGEKGSVTITGHEEFRTGIFRSEAIKPTGAGDSFLGGFLASLAAGGSVKDSVLHGSAAAAIVVTRVGCAPAMPTREETNDFLAGHAADCQISQVFRN